jgi:hypothetical protein
LTECSRCTKNTRCGAPLSLTGPVPRNVEPSQHLREALRETTYRPRRVVTGSPNTRAGHRRAIGQAGALDRPTSLCARCRPAPSRCRGAGASKWGRPSVVRGSPGSRSCSHCADEDRPTNLTKLTKEPPWRPLGPTCFVSFVSSGRTPPPLGRLPITQERRALRVVLRLHNSRHCRRQSLDTRTRSTREVGPPRHPSLTLAWRRSAVWAPPRHAR